MKISTARKLGNVMVLLGIGFVFVFGFTIFSVAANEMYQLALYVLLSVSLASAIIGFLILDMIYDQYLVFLTAKYCEENNKEPVFSSLFGLSVSFKDALKNSTQK